MRLDFICAENVQHFERARFEVIRNQRAMAAPPDCFRAHDRGRTGFRSNIEQALNASLELLRLHVIGVTAERGIAPGGVF